MVGPGARGHCTARHDLACMRKALARIYCHYHGFAIWSDQQYMLLQAEACRTGQLYVVNILSAQGSVLSEVAFNSETGCMGANTVKVGLRPIYYSIAGYPQILFALHAFQAP